MSNLLNPPVLTVSDVIVQSRDINADADSAFEEAKAESDKGKGEPKSLDLISRSTLKALEKAREEIAELKTTLKELEKRLAKLEKKGG